MNYFRVFLLLVWIVLAIITYQAIRTLGFYEIIVVMTDLGNMWRVQIYTDFISHGLVFIFWIIYREKSLKVGILCSLGVLAMGGLFTFAYLLNATYRVNGDMERLLLGKNYLNRIK